MQNKNNVGYAKANNQGIRNTRGRFILLLNPDTIIFNDSIQKMVNCAKNNPEIGIIGCRVSNPGDKLQWDSCGSFLTPLTLFMKASGLERLFPGTHFLGRRLMRYWPRDSSRLVDWVSGVCMLVRKKTIEEIGILDERFFAYMEDMDLCRRTVLTRWKVFFLHDAEIYHDSAASWRHRSERQLRTSLMSERMYLEKHYGKPSTLLFKTLYLFGSCVRLFLNILLKNRAKARNHYSIIGWLFTDRI